MIYIKNVRQVPIKKAWNTIPEIIEKPFSISFLEKVKGEKKEFLFRFSISQIMGLRSKRSISVCTTLIIVILILYRRSFEGMTLNR